MGLAMGFGLIVDNAIVVLENVYRRWQGGESAPSAAEGGTREVVLPILASTATTLIVFVPFVYLQGELRVFYVPLAIVVGLTLVASLFVAFTFIPSLAARVLRGRGAPSSPPSTTGAAAPAGDASHVPEAPARRPLYVRFYADVVGFTVRHPWIAFLVTALCLRRLLPPLRQVRHDLGRLRGGAQHAHLHQRLHHAATRARTSTARTSWWRSSRTSSRASRRSSSTRPRSGPCSPTWRSPSRTPWRTRRSPWRSRSRCSPTATRSRARRYACTGTGRRSTAEGRARPTTRSPCWATTTSGCATSPRTSGAV